MVCYETLLSNKKEIRKNLDRNTKVRVIEVVSNPIRSSEGGTS